MSVASATQGTCPNPQNRDLDYNCALGPTYLIPGLTDLTGWTNPSQYRNILVGDLDGDQLDELVARGMAGIEVYRFDRSRGQWTQVQSSTSPNNRTTILSDAVIGTDAAHRKYWDTIRLGDIDGDGKKELVVRLSTGVVVFRFTPFPINRDGTWDSGIWEQVTASGPMADTDCFSNGKCWGDDPGYYSTIQLAPIGRLGGKPTMQLVGRGGDGVELYRWNGSGWTRLTTLPDLSSANGFDAPEYYTTILFSEEWADLLLVRGPSGMQAYRFNAGSGTWQRLDYTGSGPFADAEGWNKPEYYSTIQVFHGLFPGVFAAFAGRGKDGVRVWALDIGSGNWTPAGPTAGPLSDADGFAQPQYYRTIQFVQLGNPDQDEFPLDALLARRAGGMVIYRLSGNKTQWIGPISADEPALADDPWAKDASYYAAIKTARLDPSSPVRSLLARGPHGIRTWRFDTGASTWTRPMPYGNFPAVDAAAFAALNDFLGIDAGNTIRNVYTGPGDPKSDDLLSFQNRITLTCTGVISGSPPRFQSCTTPPGYSGVPSAAWTAVSNQIIAELFLARQVISHFETLSDIQTTLFVDEINQNLSLVADLKLVEQQNVSATINYLGLFEAFYKVLATIPIPGLQTIFAVTASGIAIAEAATPHGSAPSQLVRTIAQVQSEMTTLQQEMEDAVEGHRHYVLADSGLSSTVGHLVDSQIWTLDKQAALSAGRQGFSVWLYEQFLPVLWDRWTVLNCQVNEGCSPPLDPNNPHYLQQLAMLEFAPPSPNAGSKKWDGLVPKQTSACGINSDDFPVCNWATLEDQHYGDVLTALRGPVTPACSYDPDAGTSWEYGCNVGLSAADVSTWPFRLIQCDFAVGTECADANPRSRHPPFQPIRPTPRPRPIP